MKPRRGVGFAAAESAGAMASRNGSASVAPAPCKNVRRDSAFFVMNIIAPSTRAASHLERHAFRDGRHQCRKCVLTCGGGSDDFPYCWNIIILQVPSDGVHQ